VSADYFHSSVSLLAFAVVDPILDFADFVVDSVLEVAVGRLDLFSFLFCSEADLLVAVSLLYLDEV